MSETECEIEYLDEDAEIVQQCVQVPTQTLKPQRKYGVPPDLLVERGLGNKRKRRTYIDDDSDYNPSDDKQPESPKRPKKKAMPSIRKVKPNYSNVTNIGNTSITRTNVVKNTSFTPIRPIKPALTDHRMRKKMNIRIPDYDDPLCLPVRALKKSRSDLQRLRNWNNVCLEHFKYSNTLLRPEKGETASSSRSIVLRNVVHKETGKQELAVWSKTSVENGEGVKKSEIFQSILPKYRERKLLSPFNLSWNRREVKFRHVSEVILTKEEQKNEETLVVYRPKEKLSAVYKSDNVKTESGDEEEDAKICLKEVVCCKVCAPCYQTSWRGNKKSDQNKSVQCPICKRPSVSVYNLLTHLKAHQSAEVKKHRRAIAVVLSKVVDYHYRCRLCLQQFLSIKSLRHHVNTHKGLEMFKCEVGSHMAS